MSHDWPKQIEDYGDKQNLLRFKPYFQADIDKNDFGNPHTKELLEVICM